MAENRKRTEKPSAHIQNCFVHLCITDTQFCKIARRSINAKWMSATVSEDLLTMSYEYFDTVGEAAGDHIHDELVKFLDRRDDDVKRKYYTYLKKISTMEAPNKTYVLSRIDTFVKQREWAEAAIEFAKLTDKQEFDEAKDLIMKALRGGALAEDDVITFAETDSPHFYNEDGAGRPLIGFGIKHLDDRLSKMKAGELVCMFAGYKVGKTWAACHLALQGLIHGLKVLFVSHEASRDMIERRLYMNAGVLTSDKDDFSKLIQLRLYERDHGDDEMKPTGQFRDMVCGSVYDQDCINKVNHTFRKFGGEIKIKKYPMGSANVATVERYLDYQEAVKGWIPDIVINDYVEKMRLPMSEQISRNDRINEAYIHLKRIADERQMLVITSSQVKTPALEKSYASEQEVCAEDSRKLGNIDLGIHFSQGRKDAEDYKFHAYVMVNRDDASKFGCTVAKCLDVGQFCLESWSDHEADENRGTAEGYETLNEEITEE